jgi:hypothetical protein
MECTTREEEKTKIHACVFFCSCDGRLTPLEWLVGRSVGRRLEMTVGISIWPDNRIDGVG